MTDPFLGPLSRPGLADYRGDCVRATRWEGCSHRFFPVSFWRFIAICVLVARNRVVMDAAFVLLRGSGTRQK
jgi:hypothetical protein